MPTATNTDSTRSVQALIDLVSTPSVSGNEAAAVRVFVDHAERLGLEASVDEAGNGLALRNATGVETRRIVLFGHIDTVPGELAVEVIDGVLHGRGAVDAKGPLAAFLMAASDLTVPDGVAIEVIAAVGEETTDSPGAHFIRERRAPAACIIGEPSGWDGVTIGYKGRLLVKAEFRKEWSHTAGADPSAADTLHAWWSSVLNAIEELQPDPSTTRLFDRVQTTIQSSITSNDGLIESAGMTSGFRLPLEISPAQLESTIRSLTPQTIDLRFTGHTEAYKTKRSDPVVRSLSTAIRAEGGTPHPKLKTGTADFNVVGPAWDCPIAAYGPGDSALDHTPQERIDLDEYQRSIRILTRAIESLADELAMHEPQVGQSAEFRCAERLSRRPGR